MSKAEALAKKRKEVVSIVRACLISSKGGVELERLNHGVRVYFFRTQNKLMIDYAAGPGEYREVEGTHIPYRELGYTSLAEFLDQGRDFCRIRYAPNGAIMINSVASEATAHIEDMVRKQRSTGKKSRSKPSMPSRFPRHTSQWQQLNPARGGSGNRGRGGGFAQYSYRRLGNLQNTQGAVSKGMNSRRAPAVTAPQRPPQAVKKTLNNNYRGSGASPQQQQQQSSGVNYIKELKKLCQTRGLPEPVFKTSSMSNKKFVSVVIVGEKRYRVFPNEYPTDFMAENEVSKIALEDLKKNQDGSIQVKDATKATAVSAGANRTSVQDLAVLVDKIVKLVGDRTNGIWSTQIDVLYKRKYNTSLPPGWESRIKDIPNCKLRVDSPIEGRFIILPRIEVESESENQKKSNISSSGDGPTSLSRPSNEVTAQPRPPKLEYPMSDGEFWNVYITHVNSTDNIFLRLLGDEHSSKLDELVTDMEVHYYKESEFPSITNPQVGRIYAAKADEEWHRVEVVDIRGIVITCFFIDSGEQEIVPSANLKEIDEKFLKLAPQAIPVSLHGFEGYGSNSEAAAEAENLLLGRSLVAEAYFKENAEIAVILNDVSTDQDINMNQRLLDNVNMPPLERPDSNSSASSLTSPTASEAAGDSGEFGLSDLSSLKDLVIPEVPAVGEFFDVTVTLAASPSNFTVQSWTEGNKLDELQQAMAKFYGKPKNRRAMKKSDFEQDRYFAVNHPDGNWYRASLNAMLDDETLAVRFVDYGDLYMAPIEQVQVLWHQFRNLPMQAINATLSDIVPVNGDWTAPDTVWFSKRVVNHQFVSQIKDARFDENEGVWKIGVSLIDTSDPVVDCYIESELVKSGSAVVLCD